MSKSVDYFLGPDKDQNQQEVQSIKQDFNKHQADPLPGKTPEQTNEAVQQAQRETNVTPAKTQMSEDKNGLDVGKGHPDLEKQDNATKIGQPTTENRQDTAKELGGIDKQEMAAISAEFSKNGISGGQDVSVNDVRSQATPGFEHKGDYSSSVERFAGQNSMQQESQQAMGREPGR